MVLNFSIWYVSFAVYFYSIANPVLNFIDQLPYGLFPEPFLLPHIAHTSSFIVNLLIFTCISILAIGGFIGFCIGAAQVYYHKLCHIGMVSGAFIISVRHPQYLCLIISGLGLLIMLNTLYSDFYISSYAVYLLLPVQS